MNIHPIFVHFPIAFLTIYAFLEITNIKILSQKNWYLYTKFTLLVVGVLGAFLALQTGEMAEHLVPSSSLIEKHAFFASSSAYIFVIIASVYLISIVNKNNFIFKNKILFTTWSLLTYLANALNKRFIVLLLAVIGLICITITGSLGGAIVYGPDIDPVVKFFYNLVNNW